MFHQAEKAGSQGFFIAVEYLGEKVLEEEVAGPGEAVPQPGVHGVGREVALIGVQAHSALALAAQLLLTEVHQPPGQPPAGQAGADDQGVDDPHLFRGGGDGPGDLAVFRELDSVEVDTAADCALLLQHPESALLKGLTGGVPGGIPAPLPVGIGDGAGVLLVQDLLIDPGDGDTRLDGIDARLDAMDVRLDGIDARLDAMDVRFDGIDARLDAMDVRFDEIDARFNRVENRLEMIDLKCDTNRKRLDDLSLDVKLAERDIRKDIKNLQDTTETLVVVLQGRGILPDPGNTIQTA